MLNGSLCLLGHIAGMIMMKIAILKSMEPYITGLRLRRQSCVLQIGMSRQMLSGIPFPLISILVGGFCGAVLTVAWTRRSKNGVDRKLSDDYGRWLVSEESVVILQAPIEMLQTPMALLRQGFEISPPMFVQHPEREHFGEDIRAAGVLSLFKTLSGFRIPS